MGYAYVKGVPYKVVATTQALVSRGNSFPVSGTVQDANGATATGESGTLNVSLTSTDGSDSIAPTTLTVTNGVFSSSAMQITGGSGDDTATIQYASSDDSWFPDTDSVEIKAPGLYGTYFGAGNASALEKASEATWEDTRSEMNGYSWFSMNGNPQFVENSVIGNFSGGNPGLVRAYVKLDALDVTTVSISGRCNNNTGSEEEFYVVYSGSAPSSPAAVVEWTIFDTITHDGDGSSDNWNTDISSLFGLVGQSIYLTVLAADDRTGAYSITEGDNETLEITIEGYSAS